LAQTRPSSDPVHGTRDTNGVVQTTVRRAPPAGPNQCLLEIPCQRRRWSRTH
jgi:hypothetical protein